VSGFAVREAFGHLAGEIYFLLIQTTQAFPRPYPSTTRALADHMRALSSPLAMRKLRNSGLPSFEATATAIFQLREILDVVEGNKTADTEQGDNSRVPWAGCEAITVMDESDHWKYIDRNDCKPLADGEEMMKCSRVSRARVTSRPQ
jgi:hypothetical protein